MASVLLGRLTTSLVGIKAAANDGTLTDGDDFDLKREHENPEDPNAIGGIDCSGKIVGFLSASVASVLAPLIDAGRVRMVNAQAGVVAPDGYTQKIGADLVTDIDDEDEQEQLIATLKAERKLKGKFRAS